MKHQNINVKNVKINSAFWNSRLSANKKSIINAQYKMLKDTGRIDAFKLDWKQGMTPVPHRFWDSDVAKWVEAAAYLYAIEPSDELKTKLDEVVNKIIGAQQPDGFLNVFFTIVEPDGRWKNLYGNHVLYCAGHLLEAAIAHFDATGEPEFLDAMKRYVDYIDSEFGPEPGKRKGYCGHQEIELALYKLYLKTGDKKHLNLCNFFVTERGKNPNYLFAEQKQELAAVDPNDTSKFTTELQYLQAHKPFVEQTEVVGHAVRAMYFFTAAADLAGELNDKALWDANKTLWNDLVYKKLYITGGIGSSSHNEGFTKPYDLPNATAYAETCASIGMLFWAWRLLMAETNREYADVIENALYNGIISGMSYDGDLFFYDNPLESNGNTHRSGWFDCSCCPPNIARLLASLGGYIYSSNEEEVAVHLYIQNEAELNIKDTRVGLNLQTEYPNDGRTEITVDCGAPVAFTLMLRIPAWTSFYSVSINHQAPEKDFEFKDGYLRINREWLAGDTVSLNINMTPQTVYSHPGVKDNVGKAALRYGPLIFCLEETDNPVAFDSLMIVNGNFNAVYDESIFNGIIKLTGSAYGMDMREWDEKLYQSKKPTLYPTHFTAIPYFLWDNREPGKMRVWNYILDED